MNKKINDLLEEIRQREEELAKLLKQHEENLSYSIDGTKIRFEKAVKRAHRRVKTGIIQWLGESELRNVASAPVIYFMIIPFALLDITLSAYQYLCFGLYRIPRVRRSDYIVIDRHHLSYLNIIEKINCVYCGYVSGLLTYSREIVARTEQYWCPIKHARKVVNPHKRYAGFARYGESEGYVEHVKVMRSSVRQPDPEPGHD
ncbi:MAG: hypothetical protein KDI17_06765 [Halioglobus sp.]|nr:hypothetical protein [Halioglobus sp.]